MNTQRDYDPDDNFARAFDPEADIDEDAAIEALAWQLLLLINPDDEDAAMQQFAACRDALDEGTDAAEALRPFTAGADLGRLIGPGGTEWKPTAAADTADAPNTVVESHAGRREVRPPTRRYALALALAGLAAAVAVAVFVWWPKRVQPTPPVVAAVATRRHRCHRYRP